MQFLLYLLGYLFLTVVFVIMAHFFSQWLYPKPDCPEGFSDCPLMGKAEHWLTKVFMPILGYVWNFLLIILCSKRIRDIGLSAYYVLFIFVFMIIGYHGDFFIPFLRLLLRPPFFEVAFFLYNFLPYTMIIIAFALIPGSKADNKFGLLPQNRKILNPYS